MQPLFAQVQKKQSAAMENWMVLPECGDEVDPDAQASSSIALLSGEKKRKTDVVKGKGKAKGWQKRG